ncbi:MAG: flagellar hook-associated protein FlgK [Desulfobacteraceae bacterium]|jgi:flagellar hook-associated protein 1 FlgK
MSSIFGILDMAGTALLTHQEAINVTGNNIANVNTPGYSRQRLILSPRVTSNSALGLIGNGVEGEGIERIYDRFVGVQINNENQSLGRWEAQKQILESIEVIFDESSGMGLSEAMNEFWNAWQDLSMNPSGQIEREVLISISENLTAIFNQKHADLESSQQGLDANIEGAVEEVNRLVAQIADLNQKIIDIELNGASANEYRDQRDLALKELSELIDISTFEDANGAVKVTLNGGLTLVDGISHRSLSTQINPATGLLDVLWVGSDGSTMDITSSISGGKLLGWLEVRDVAIPDYLTRLNDLASTLMQEVNALHSAGFGLDESTGYDFFTGTDASDIQVNIDLVNDANLIAAAPDLAGVPGDSSNALAIADLQNRLTMNGGTTTFDDYYGTLVSNVGSDVLSVNANYEHQFEMVTHFENYRESISGVNLDEEMVNLVKFQSAYDAAARLVTTTDEMIQTVLGMI